ncbi:CubicO group peptidase, beta-lactamase class C family [Tangfeifania diversioriginum]|uniref:CubicO group peptidase, beta-lactamase class C family n=1 Tax=Tangfeifania diversioriginum TaxID=1168035 RepID=A0A1M6EHZ5_9BACT|nr:serine hydrolase domain-containing protein [Tangfeifania diversioriginum]SHI85094.1 CubicO group peptidase, beta-lactamase class C family [Tangfeifania diversioriginum]
MKNFFSTFIVLMSAVLIQFSCSTNVNSEVNGLSVDTLELAGEKMQEYIDSGKLAGISALIYKDGETVYRENFGFADLEAQKPMEDNTIFRIFSMTKPITAVALMTLYDEGKFKLDDKVSTYIPEFAATKVYNSETKTLEPQQEEMTIRHLLTHTSGIPYGWDQNAYVDSLYRVSGAGGWEGTIGEKVKIMASLPLKHQPGTTWEYGLSIDVAGYLVEVLSGMPFDEYLKTQIFEPLGMDDTGFYAPKEKHDRLSALHAVQSGNLKNAEGGMSMAFMQPVTLFSGGGGLVSTMDDYLQFSKMLLNGGELNGKRIIEESTAQLILSDQLPDGVRYEGDKGYGLGGSYDPETGEYGWAGAASTKFWINPENDMIVITGAQLMPADYTYANEFKSIVDRAVTD